MSVLVTGAAGFIGFHVASALLARGKSVVGLDNLSPYYDPALKSARLAELTRSRNFRFVAADLADAALIEAHAATLKSVTAIVHLAAQPGVRHSLIVPHTYVAANVAAQVTILELARRLPRLDHLVYASTSAVYGGNSKLPFSTDDPVDQPLSLYGATKRSAELVAIAYARLHDLRLTGLRFFTVYGPWGRPDMATWIFTRNILAGVPIEVHEGGRMRRDFTYIDDIVTGLLAVLANPPKTAPAHRLYNIGNSHTEWLDRFIAVLESAIGRKAIRIDKPMEPGEVLETYADIAPMRADFGWRPETTIDEGLPRFVEWYRTYHGE